MNARAWRTGEPLDPGFERDWNATLAGAPYAHFAFRLDYLKWMHELGTPGIAVQTGDAGARGLIAARLERGAWCGCHGAGRAPSSAPSARRSGSSSLRTRRGS
jgi:hypothetical protein